MPQSSGLRWLLAPLLGLGLGLGLGGPALAQGCDSRQAVAFSDGSRVCLHEKTELPWPPDRRSWRPAYNGLYSVAAGGLAGHCPLALGVGTNINSMHDWYAKKRDETALQQCRSGLRERQGSNDCSCELVIKDGVALIDRSEFNELLTRAQRGLQPATPPQAAASPARTTALQPDPPAPEPIPVAVAPAPVAAIVAAAPAAAPAVPAAAPLPPLPPRRALVIGNRDYLVGALRNPINDARAMAAKLGQLGFTSTLVENLKRDDIGPVIDRFIASVQPGDDVLLFYAGHGLQIRGLNYLPAVDANIRSESDVALNSIHLNQVLERLDEARAGVRLLLIDACRDNPYARSYRSGQRGLARIDAAPAGTLIHFATRPGGVSADGDGEHGLYTQHLLQYLPSPGVPVEQMLKRVASAVRKASGNEQLPWTEGSLDGDFYFVPPP